MARTLLSSYVFCRARFVCGFLHSLFFISVLGLNSLAWAGESDCSPVQLDRNVDAPSAHDGELKAYLDPDTGEFISEPTQTQAQAEGVSAQPPQAELLEEVLPDGTVMLDLSDTANTELRAEIVDGQIVTCHRPGVKSDVAELDKTIRPGRENEP